MKSIIEEVPDKADMIEVVQVDVGSDESCKAAAEVLKAKGVKLYALVNNAGVGWGSPPDAIMNTNFMGPKRVTDAFVGIINSGNGRIVNVSSGAASSWVKQQGDDLQKKFSSPDITFQDLEESVKANVKDGNDVGYLNYGLSKAALCSLTMIQARENPNLMVVSLSPGFVATSMTAGVGSNKLTPEQGCLSSIKCLFGEVTRGFYYGSDGLRSPLTVSRDPGTPEYQGESNPDPAKYNRT